MKDITLSISTSNIYKAIRQYFIGDEFHLVDDNKKLKLNGGDGEFTLDMVAPNTEINLKSAPQSLLRALSANKYVSNSDRAKISKILPKIEVLDKIIGTPQAFYRAMKAVEANNKPQYEVEFNGRWYPIPLTVSVNHNMWLGSYVCTMKAAAKLSDETMNWRFQVSGKNFIGSDGKEQVKKIRDLLKEMGLRPTTPEAIKDLTKRLSLSEKMRAQHGKVVDVKSSIISKTTFFFWQTLQKTNLGTAEKPRLLIVEDDLEGSEDQDSYYDEEQQYDLPFIRAFSPDMKRYVYVDVADVVEHEFDHGGRDRLVLPDDMRQILDAVFETHTNNVFGDMFRGRHGGMVILANGQSGVGKTLTAEVFSEYTDRPLYVLEMGELGTNLESVEQNLQKIFARAARWNAILLFDEADIFLSKRGEDLDRSAIVGVFLRLLDMYEGTFFLTTNRAEVMDPAFKSRITLKLDYPELSNQSRAKVWKNLLKAANFNVEDEVISSISNESLNGRQVRNLVRLLKILHPNTSALSTEQIKNIFRYAAK